MQQNIGPLPAATTVDAFTGSVMLLLCIALTTVFETTLAFGTLLELANCSTVSATIEPCL